MLYFVTSLLICLAPLKIENIVKVKVLNDRERVQNSVSKWAIRIDFFTVNMMQASLHCIPILIIDNFMFAWCKKDLQQFSDKSIMT